MFLGIFFSFLTTICFSFANILQKFFSLKINIYLTLLIQYVILTIIGFVFILLFDSFYFSPTYVDIIIIMINSIIGYIGILTFIKGLNKLNTAIVLVISRGYIFVSYFINIYLFPNIEGFSNIKLILSIIIFLLTGIFLFEKQGQNIKINKNIFLPIITFISWGLYYSTTNYLIKKEILDPFQLLFYDCLLISIISTIIVIIYGLKKAFKENKINKQMYILYVLYGIFEYGGIVFVFLAFKYISGNIVNFISLIGIIFTAFLAFIFLKEKLNKKEIIISVLSIIFLALFIIL